MFAVSSSIKFFFYALICTRNILIHFKALKRHVHLILVGMIRVSGGSKKSDIFFILIAIGNLRGCL